MLLGIGFSMPTMLIVAAVFILLFGANRIPDLMKSLGKSVTEFKKGINDKPDDDGPSKS